MDPEPSARFGRKWGSWGGGSEKEAGAPGGEAGLGGEVALRPTVGSQDSTAQPLRLAVFCGGS
jgi:hypothetical protein